MCSHDEFRYFKMIQYPFSAQQYQVLIRVCTHCHEPEIEIEGKWIIMPGAEAPPKGEPA